MMSDRLRIPDLFGDPGKQTGFAHCGPAKDPGLCRVRKRGMSCPQLSIHVITFHPPERERARESCLPRAPPRTTPF